MMRQCAIALALAVLPVGAPAFARPTDELVEIRSRDALEIREDRAYLLFRVPQQRGVRPLEPLLMRVPSAGEIARYEAAKTAAYAEELPALTRQYERDLERYQRSGDTEARAPQPPSLEGFDFVWDEVANLQDVDYGDQFVKTDTEETFLVEAVPGDYVLYGLTPSTGLPHLMMCLCLGTVGFTAKAGEVTDLGYLISDYTLRQSEAPELQGAPGISGTVRPARTDSSMPAALSDATVVSAQYRAVGRFFTPNALSIGRLVAVPGVLEYDRGQVVDAMTGKKVPDNF